MLRLKRKLNLGKMSKVSASCPAINEVHLDDEDSDSPDTSSQHSDNSVDSDVVVPAAVSRKERILALKSTRRDRKREKDKQKKIQSNNISMDDFLSKQTEFKIWLKEEKNKQPKDLTSPKIKTYFKTFVKQWNRKKLNQKFYRGSQLLETPPPSAIRQRFIFTDDTCSNTSLFPGTINLSMEGPDSMNSPFSTFGKSPLGLPIPRGRHHGKFLPANKDETEKENTIQVDKESEIENPVSVHSENTASTSSNLYKVSVLSWTSKGELTTDQRSTKLAKPIPPLRCPVLSKQPASVLQDKSLIYHEVEDTASSRSTSPRKQQIQNDYLDPGYMDPDLCTKDDTAKCSSGDRNWIPQQQATMKKAQSLQAIYAVPLKKKKIGSSKKGNTCISKTTAMSPPPVPPKRKSPLECWPFDNNLMGTNVPPPCYLNKAFQKKHLEAGGCHSIRNDMKLFSSVNRISEENGSNLEEEDVKGFDAEGYYRPRQLSTGPQSGTLTTITEHVPSVTRSFHTPDITDKHEDDERNPSDSTSRDAASLSTFKPLRYETTFSANDTDLPVKTPCCDDSSAANNATDPVNSQSSKFFSSSSTSACKQKDSKRGDALPHGHSDVNRGKETNQFLSSIARKEKKLPSEISTDCKTGSGSVCISSMTNRKMSTNDNNIAAGSGVTSSASSQHDLSETDIDDVNSEVDNSSSLCSDYVGRGFIETDLDEVLENITQKKITNSTHWLVDTAGETTV